MALFNDGVQQAGTFLNRQLEQHIPGVYEKKYPVLWAERGMYLPAVGDLEEGARDIIETTATEVGEALISSDGSDDVPLVDVSMDEFPLRHPVSVRGIKYSVPELKKAMKANQDIRVSRLNALRKAIAQRIHKLAVFGSAKNGMKGLFNHSQINAVNSSYDADDTSLTAQDHIDFITQQMIKVESDTNLVEGVETILVPAKLFNVWSNSFLPGTSENVLRNVLLNHGAEAGGTLKQIKKVTECQSSYMEKFGVHSAGTNKDRLMFLPFDPQALERKFYDLQFMEPQLHGMSYLIVGYAGTSECIAHYPGAALYVDIPKL